MSVPATKERPPSQPLKIGFAFGAGGIYAAAMASAVERAVFDLTGVDVNTATQSIGTSGGAAYLAYRSVMTLDQGDEILRGGSDSDLKLNALLRLTRLRDSHRLTGSARQRAAIVGRLGQLYLDRRRGLIHVLDADDPRLLRGLFPCPIDRPAAEDLGGRHLGSNIWIAVHDIGSRQAVVLGRDVEHVSADVEVGASCAIPFVYPGKFIEGTAELRGKCLVDGGVSSRTNVKELVNLGLDWVVAVSPMARDGNEASIELDQDCEWLERMGTRVVKLHIPREANQPKKYQDFMRAKNLGPGMNGMYRHALAEVSAAFGVQRQAEPVPPYIWRQLVLERQLLPQ